MEKLWERFFYSLDDKNSVNGLRRLVNNAEFISAFFEANGMLSEATATLNAYKLKNKKLNLTTHNRDIDNILVYIFLKSIITIPSKTKAYKLGLINKNGMLIRNPSTPQENEAISNLDLLMFKLRDWLKPKMSLLASINWLEGSYRNQRLQNCLLNTEMLSKHYVIQKLNNELATILRK